MMEPEAFATFGQVTVFKGKIFSQVIVDFKDMLGKEKGGCVKFEIDIDGVVNTEIILPKIHTYLLPFGIDVVGIWQKVGLIENGQNSFFTDSNSLELVERVVLPSDNKLIP